MDLASTTRQQQPEGETSKRIPPNADLKKHLHADGADVRVYRATDGKRAYLRLSTAYDMRDQTYYAVTSELMLGLQHADTKVRIGRRGGLAGPLKAHAAGTVAYKVLRLVRLDKQYAEIERMHVPGYRPERKRSAVVRKQPSGPVVCLPAGTGRRAEKPV